MIEIGDKIILNKKKEDNPMIPNNQWERHIRCKVVFISMNGTYLVRDGFGHESLVSGKEFFKIRNDITILPADDPNRRKIYPPMHVNEGPLIRIVPKQKN